MEYTPAGRPSAFTLPETADPADLQVILSDFADDTLNAHGDTVTGNYDITGTLTADTVVGLGAIIVCTSASRPVAPSAGQHIYETDTLTTKVWDGAAWADVTGAPAAAGASWPEIFLMMGA